MQPRQLCMSAQKNNRAPAERAELEQKRGERDYAQCSEYKKSTAGYTYGCCLRNSTMNTNGLERALKSHVRKLRGTMREALKIRAVRPDWRELQASFPGRPVPPRFKSKIFVEAGSARLLENRAQQPMIPLAQQRRVDTGPNPQQTTDSFQGNQEDGAEQGQNQPEEEVENTGMEPEEPPWPLRRPRPDGVKRISEASCARNRSSQSSPSPTHWQRFPVDDPPGHQTKTGGAQEPPLMPIMEAEPMVGPSVLESAPKDVDNGEVSGDPDFGSDEEAPEEIQAGTQLSCRDGGC